MAVYPGEGKLQDYKPGDDGAALPLNTPFGNFEQGTSSSSNSSSRTSSSSSSSGRSGTSSSSSSIESGHTPDDDQKQWGWLVESPHPDEWSDLRGLGLAAVGVASRQAAIDNGGAVEPEMNLRQLGLAAAGCWREEWAVVTDSQSRPPSLGAGCGPEQLTPGRLGQGRCSSGASKAEASPPGSAEKKIKAAKGRPEKRCAAAAPAVESVLANDLPFPPPIEFTRPARSATATSSIGGRDKEKLLEELSRESFLGSVSCSSAAAIDVHSNSLLAGWYYVVSLCVLRQGPELTSSRAARQLQPGTFVRTLEYCRNSRQKDRIRTRLGWASTTATDGHKLLLQPVAARECYQPVSWPADARVMGRRCVCN